MKTTELELTEKELNLLMDALYKRWSLGTLEEKPESFAAKLMDKLYEAKRFTKSDTTKYEVGVEVKESPSKSDKLTWVEYTVEATSEEDARRKASDLCGEEFGHNPWSTEII